MKRDERSLSDSLLGWRAGSAWLILIAVAAWGVRPGTAATMKPGAPAIAAPASDGEPANALLAAEAATIDLFDTASRSVVCIRTFSRHVEESAGAVHELPLGAGSGFVWDRQGHVVTNFHVIDGAEQVEVALADHSHWRARLVGIAPELDLAVLRVDAPAERLVPLPVGDSTRVRVGQTVLAVGNPFGFDHTLTTGIVSALGRTVDSPSGARIHDVSPDRRGDQPRELGRPADRQPGPAGGRQHGDLRHLRFLRRRRLRDPGGGGGASRTPARAPRAHRPPESRLRARARRSAGGARPRGRARAHRRPRAARRRGSA
jgi:hypothetical protein